MNVDQVEQYVQHRLQVAGYKGAPVFGHRACQMMVSACRGTARLINVVSHKALMLAYGEGKHEVTLEHIKYAVKDTEATQRRIAGMSLQAVGLAAAGVVIAVTVIAGMWFSGGAA